MINDATNSEVCFDTHTEVASKSSILLRYSKSPVVTKSSAYISSLKPSSLPNKSTVEMPCSLQIDIKDLTPSAFSIISVLKATRRAGNEGTILKPFRTYLLHKSKFPEIACSMRIRRNTEGVLSSVISLSHHSLIVSSFRISIRLCCFIKSSSLSIKNILQYL